MVEIIIVIAMLGIFSSVSVVSYYNFKSHESLLVTTYDVVESMRHAKSNAQKMKQDSKWGIKLLADKIVVFSGTSYASRNTSFDQNIDIQNGISVSGQDEIVFEKITGSTNDVGTTTITGQDNYRDIYINEKGTITY